MSSSTMSAGLFGIAGGEQNVTDALKDTRIGLFCKIEDDRIAVNNGISAIRVVIGHRNVARDLRKLIDPWIITPIYCNFQYVTRDIRSLQMSLGRENMF